MKLPEDVNTDAAHAVLGDGILRISMPKRVAAKPKKIAIQRG